MNTGAAARLQLIVARARNGIIGNRGKLPWHLPEDLAHFRRTTMGHAVVMGRRTWDSIGRPLPGRRNIVVTRSPHWHAAGAEAAASLDDALALCAVCGQEGAGAERAIFVIGGAQLYAQALARPVAIIHLTEINADFEGDAIFPPLDAARWRECARMHLGPGGARPYALDFVRYEARPAWMPALSTPGGIDAQR